MNEIKTNGGKNWKNEDPKEEPAAIISSTALLACPFCGSKPEVAHHFNDEKKTRGVIIKCGCGARLQRYCGGPADYYTIEWLESVARQMWNKRAS